MIPATCRYAVRSVPLPRVTPRDARPLPPRNKPISAQVGHHRVKGAQLRNVCLYVYFLLSRVKRKSQGLPSEQSVCSRVNVMPLRWP